MNLPAKAFKPVMGQAKIVDERLVVTAFESDGQRGTAIISHWRSIDSRSYRFLSISKGQASPDLEAKLFWRSASARDELYSQTLPKPLTAGNVTDLRLNPQWTGDIAEIGLVFTAWDPEDVVSLSGMTLESCRPVMALRALLSQWTALRKFDQTTINARSGTFSSGVLSPLVAVAAWTAISLILIALLSFSGRAVSGFAGLWVVLIAWVVLDLLWQRQLSGQLQLTQHLFQDRSMAERHLRDLDRDYYQHAMQLKAEALPSEPVRLFILHNSHDHNYQRLKMQYYLLPHNIYNFGLVPPDNAVKPGDYVLVLGEVPGLQFEATDGLLKWNDSRVLSASLVNAHRLGKLYVIGGDALPPAVDSGERPSK